jgi:hypothetical protein
LQCILTFLKNNVHDKNYAKFVQMFRERTDFKTVIGQDYIDCSLRYQTIAQDYLAKVGLSGVPGYSEYISTLIKDSFIPKLFEKARAVAKVRSIFDMLSQISQESRGEI